MLGCGPVAIVAWDAIGVPVVEMVAMTGAACALAAVVLGGLAWDGWRRWLAFQERHLVSEDHSRKLEERMAALERRVEPVLLAREFGR